MDELLFNPRIMADVNGNSKMVSAELEVKKLQELVRKLERQNEQLRTRANAANNCSRPPPAPASASAGSVYCVSPSTFSPSLGVSDDPFPYFHPQSGAGADALDEVEILDLRLVLPVEEESDYTWLYVPPKARLFHHHLLSPLQWSRHVLDNPRSDVELAKRSLCYKLDQAKRWRGLLSGSSAVVGSPLVSGLVSLGSSTKQLTKPPLTGQTEGPKHLLLSSESSPPPNQQTSHMARNCLSLTERSPTFLYHTAGQSNSLQKRPLSPQSSVDSELSVSELEEDSVSMSYKLQDMTDVEVMARLQEDSLRQEYASSTATSTRRSASFSTHTGARRSRRPEAELDEEDEEDDQISAPQPRLFRTASMQRSVSHSHSLSSPQFLSALSYQPQHARAEPPTYRASADKLRRSMPNLIRAPSIPSVISSPSAHVSPLSLLRNSQSFDSHNALHKIHNSIPSPGPLQHRVQSVGNFSTASRPLAKATAYVSPTVQSATTMPSSASLNCVSSKASFSFSSRSALPRPASFVGTNGLSRSKIAQPVRSLLAPPKSVSALSALRDGSWRDGCY